MMRDPERRRLVESICDAALDRPRAERTPFVAERCGDDRELREEIESLLAGASDAPDSTDAPLGRLAAAVLPPPPAPGPRLSTGARLGPYVVVAPLGAGGMGEVYRARDERLGREVALKVLPASLAADAERAARFEREARALAALNHPNIAQIHGLEEADGVTALALELVEGTTLAERLRPGPLSLADALRTARHVAEALHAAHDRGIVHRDLKPANIMVAADGRVKVLDFGLAARFEHRSAPLTSRVVTDFQTDMGGVLGTAAYMSPEQASGKSVDKRTDIWAFGCVLYEMLTGVRTFDRGSAAETVAAVLEREPDWTTLPASIPPSVRTLLTRCLAKDPQARVADISTALYVLDAVTLGESAPDASAPAIATGRARSAWRVIAASLAAAALAVATLVWRTSDEREPDRPRSVVRASIALGSETSIVGGTNVALSPDGSLAMYFSRRQLYRRRLDGAQSEAVPGVVGGRSIFFSPDGATIGYATGSRLERVAVAGGASEPIVAATDVAGASWGDDGYVVYGSRREDGLFRVRATGGTPERLTTVTAEDGSNDHRFPEVLPGSHAVVFCVCTGPEEDARIVVLDRRTGQRKDLVRGSASARYVATGHLVYARNAELFAAPFDVDRLEFTGPHERIASDVSESTDGDPEYAFSSSGDLVYVPGWSGALRDDLVFVDMAGRVTDTAFPRGGNNSPRVTRDGREIAVLVGGAKNNAWTYDAVRGTSTRATFGRYHYPVWTLDGRLAMAKGPPGRLQLVLREPDRETERVLTVPGTPQYPGDWTPDGRTLIYQQQDREGHWDLWQLSAGESAGVPLTETKFDELHPRVSPNGRWLAFVSNETGRPEVYIRPLVGGGRRLTVSHEGGAFAEWAPDGQRLYYRRLGQRGARSDMWAVDIAPDGDTLAISTPRSLFAAPALATEFDVHPDGRRFVMIRENPGPPRNELRLVLNAMRPAMATSSR